MSNEQTKKQLSTKDATQYAMFLLVRAAVCAFIARLNLAVKAYVPPAEACDFDNFSIDQKYLEYSDMFKVALSKSYRNVGTSLLNGDSGVWTMVFYVLNAGYGVTSAYYQLRVMCDIRCYFGKITIESLQGSLSYEFSSDQLRIGYPDDRGNLKIAVVHCGEDDENILRDIGESAIVSYVDDYVGKDQNAFFPTYVRTIFDRFKSLVKKS